MCAPALFEQIAGRMNKRQRTWLELRGKPRDSADYRHRAEILGAGLNASQSKRRLFEAL